MDKRKITFFILSTVAISCLGFLLEYLYSDGAKKFFELYKAFDITALDLAYTINNHLDNWAIITAASAVLCYSFIFIGNNKLQYLSILLPLLFSAIVFLTFYIPVVHIGPAI